MWWALDFESWGFFTAGGVGPSFVSSITISENSTSVGRGVNKSGKGGSVTTGGGIGAGIGMEFCRTTLDCNDKECDK